VDARFADLIVAAGGLPAFIPPTENAEALAEFIDSVDAVILSGGPDIPPERYGREAHPATSCMHPRRECSDFRAIELAEGRGLPLLAICLGIQEWNVYRGGTLHQHVPDLTLQPAVAHRDGPAFAFHSVRLAAGSLIQSIVRTNPLPVNSSHHQCLDQLGASLVATAWAEDGIVEAVQDPRRRFALGIQWHPEDMPDDPIQRRIFQALVAAAKT
jgi:gamma-glutamyl-gamma-aminobutyrate hydrolase PuuD